MEAAGQLFLQQLPPMNLGITGLCRIFFLRMPELELAGMEPTFHLLPRVISQ